MPESPRSANSKWALSSFLILPSRTRSPCSAAPHSVLHWNTNDSKEIRVTGMSPRIMALTGKGGRCPWILRRQPAAGKDRTLVQGVLLVLWLGCLGTRWWGCRREWVPAAGPRPPAQWPAKRRKGQEGSVIPSYEPSYSPQSQCRDLEAL